MALSTIFANLPTGNNAAALIDTNMNQLGAMAVTACTATGTNTIALSPNANQPSVTTYGNYQQFSFVAAANSTGSVTINVNSVGALPLYRTDGTQVGSGDISSGVLYTIAYNSALNTGTGGFQLLQFTLHNTALVVPSINFGQTNLNWYEQGTVTASGIAMTFVTPGDLSVSYTTRDVTFTRIGNRVLLRGLILTSSFTWTTSSGNFMITGACPYNPAKQTFGIANPGNFSSMTGGIYAEVNTSGQIFLSFTGTGNGSLATTSQAASGSNKQVDFNIIYEV